MEFAECAVLPGEGWQVWQTGRFEGRHPATAPWNLRRARSLGTGESGSWNV